MDIYVYKTSFWKKRTSSGKKYVISTFRRYAFMFLSFDIKINKYVIKVKLTSVFKGDPKAPFS